MVGQVQRRLMSLLLGVSMFIYAAMLVEALQVEQTQAVMPVIDVYLYDTDSELSEASADVITASMDGAILTVEDIKPASDIGGGIQWFYLLDISGSVPAQHFLAAKDAILTAYTQRKPNDSVSVISFGDEVTTLLQGTEPAAEAAEKLEHISARDNHTALYAAIKRAMELASMNTGKRNIVVIFTDGTDDTQADVTRPELEAQLQSNGLSLYTFCADTAPKEVRDELGGFVRTTGGELYLFNGGTLDQEIQRFHRRIESCLLLRLRTDTNVADGKQHDLTIRYGDITLSTPVTTAKWARDDTNPEVISVEYVASIAAVRIRLSEPVTGGDNPANFDLMGEDGTHIALASARYEGPDGACVELLPETPPFEGRYTLTVSGLTDRSMERNAIKKEQLDISLVTGVFPEPEPEPAEPQTPWWVYAGCGVVAIAVVVLLILLLRKKRRTEQENVVLDTVTEKFKRHILNGKGVVLRVSISDGRGTSTETEFTLLSSLIFGRSDACDVYFDDKRMSRQHCAMEYKDGNLLVQDLESENGTMVNGVPISAPYPMRPGDELRIGDTTIRLLQIDA